MMNPIDAYRENIPDEKFDYIVIGSGAGGAVVAKELAEGGARVAVVEEGHYHSQHRDLAVDAVKRLYRSGGTTSTIGNPVIPVPLGQTFGGSTTINSGTCFRLPDNVLENWQSKHGLELPSEEFRKHFERVERELSIQDSEFEVMGKSNILIHNALKARGIPGRPLKRNIRRCVGRGMCCYGCDTGAKQSMERSYLPKAMQAGATAITGFRASRIEIAPKSGTPYGISGYSVERKTKKKGKKLFLRGDKVVVAAGTFLTPSILKASRIARSNPHLGRHLTLHPATKIYAEFEEDIRGWEGTPQAYYIDEHKEQGITYEGIFMPPDVMGFTLPFVGKEFTDFVLNYKRMATFGVMITDSAEGRLTRLPLLGDTYLYSLTPNDVERFKKAIHFMGELFFEAGAKRIIPLVHGVYRPIESIKELNGFRKRKIKPSQIESMGFHPLGTCRMGKDARSGVIDSNYEVFGQKNVFVCDGSIMPTALGVNPQETIMAMATRFASQQLSTPLS